MEAVRCPKGHYYDKTAHEACPICASSAGAEQNPFGFGFSGPETVVGNVVKCSAGHYFDRSINGSCPVCALQTQPVETAFEEEETAPPEFPDDVLTCGKGHRYLRALGSCPICAAQADTFENIGATVPVANLVTCPNGHTYDRSLSASCPICANAQTAIEPETLKEQEEVQPILSGPEKAFADTVRSDEMLLFTAFQGLSYRIRIRKGQVQLHLRSLVNRKGMILEDTILIPMEDTMDAARKILGVLTENGKAAFLNDPDCETGNSRFLFNTRQLNCDHRWEEIPSLAGSSAEFYMSSIHAILGDLYARYTKGSMSGSTDEELFAQLDHGNLDLHLFWEEGGYTLSLRERIYYQFTTSLLLRSDARITPEEAEELLTWLADCGLMEALIEKNKRPDNGICRDPGMATAFYLKRGSLTFQYRDWNKPNSGKEGPLLNTVQDRLMALFAKEQEIPLNA